MLNLLKYSFLFFALSLSLLKFKPLCAGYNASKKVIPTVRKSNFNKDSLEWKRYLKIYLSIGQIKTIPASPTIFDQENTRFFTSPINNYDSLLVVETSVESGSAGPQIILIQFHRKNSITPKFKYVSYGIIKAVEKKEGNISIKKYNRGYNWEPQLSEIIYKNHLVNEQVISRGNIAIEILRLLPNVNSECKKVNFDCLELYGTSCDTIYYSAKQNLIFVYNKEKTPWFFTSPKQMKEGKEILGFLYLKMGSILRNVATVLNADTLYKTNYIYHKMPMLVGKTGTKQTIFYIFDGKYFKIYKKIRMHQKLVMQKILYNK